MAASLLCIALGARYKCALCEPARALAGFAGHMCDWYHYLHGYLAASLGVASAAHKAAAEMESDIERYVGESSSMSA
eukprot:5135506-Amphidinium_carterae.1